MEIFTIEAITVVLGASIFVGEKFYKKCKYIKKKRNLKKKLFKSIKENNKTNIKKYIIKLKDFDYFYQTNKLLKYLEFCCRTIPELIEDNIYSLITDFYFIDMIYDNERQELEVEITDNLDEKLKQLERKKKEILIRANRIKGQTHLKNSKMNKNLKRRKGRMG